MTLDELIELTKEVESQDPIDWGMLNISEDEALRLIALDVMEMFQSYQIASEKEVVMLVTITKLILENFVLNLQLHNKR